MQDLRIHVCTNQAAICRHGALNTTICHPWAGRQAVGLYIRSMYIIRSGTFLPVFILLTNNITRS